MARLYKLARTEVFRNLTRKCYSVRKYGRVIAHTDNITLRYADFVIQPAGQARVRREGKKYVHAFVRGEEPGMVLDHDAIAQIHAGHPNWVEVSYNPYKNDTFVVKATGQPVHSATFVFLSAKGCYAEGIR